MFCVLSIVGPAEHTSEGDMTENQNTSKCRPPWVVRVREQVPKCCFAWTLKLRLPGLDSEAGFLRAAPEMEILGEVTY